MNLSALRSTQSFRARSRRSPFEELNQLEANILRDGRIINPIIVGGGAIVDGHNRYHCQEDLTPEQKKYLIGKQYEAEK